MRSTDGSELHRLTWLSEDQPMAAFSPNGTQLAVMGNSGTYVLNSDGSHTRRIDPAGDHGGLVWDAP